MRRHDHDVIGIGVCFAAEGDPHMELSDLGWMRIWVTVQQVLISIPLPLWKEQSFLPIDAGILGSGNCPGDEYSLFFQLIQRQ